MADDHDTKFNHLLDFRLYDNFPDFLHACSVTSIFADRLNNKILYVLHLCRFSNPYELRLFLKESSRTVITHRFESLVNNGLIDIKGKSDADYLVYRNFWKQHHPFTRGDLPFFIPTDFTDQVIQTVHSNWTGIIDTVIAQKAHRRGKTFQQFYKHQVEKEIERQRQKEQAAMESKGVCVRCNHNITKNTPHECFRGRLFCRQCIREIHLTGEWEEISLEHNR